MRSRPSVVLVSRELAPFGGGGIAEYVWSTARLLSRIADVTVVTTSLHENDYRRMRARQDPRLLPDEIEHLFVEEPSGEEPTSFYSFLHLYSARVWEALVRRFPQGGPDLLEFPDYLGEGFCTLQARRTGSPLLRKTLVCLRAHTSSEMAEVLNGHTPQGLESEVTYEMERYALEHADRFLWAGGDVLGTYERYYSPAGVAPSARIRHPLDLELPAAPAARREGEELRMLYFGRLERRKGVQNLLRAATSLTEQKWSLTLIGADTDTAPLGVSMRGQLELMAGDDHRVEFQSPLSRTEVAAAVQGHDVVVLPSLWECWPYTALEAMRLGRPIVATPTGGLTELVRHEVSGWLTADTTAGALADTLAAVIRGREDVRRMIADETPQERLDELSDEEAVLDSYRELLGADRSRRWAAVEKQSAPLVSAVVPYYRCEEFVERTVESLTSQTYPAVEIVVVNDGSFRDADWILAELATRYPIAVHTQDNRGLGAARNFGIRQSRGKYVFPLDADNCAEPTFVERCVEVLEADRDVAYVGSWSRFIDEDDRPDLSPSGGYEPLGNWSRLVERVNVAGDAAAVIPRRIFDLGFWYSHDLTSFEDWAFYQALHNAGRFGHVIPERLLLYRIRARSMIREVGLPHKERLLGEMRALSLEGRIEWVAKGDSGGAP